MALQPKMTSRPSLDAIIDLTNEVMWWSVADMSVNIAGLQWAWTHDQKG